MTKVINASNITLIGFGDLVPRSIKDKARQFNFSVTSQDENIEFLEPMTIIECNSSNSGFLFNSINSLSLINLSIVNCGANSTHAGIYS